MPGSQQLVVVCAPRTDGGVAIAPCGTIDSVGYQPTTVSAYVFDPSSGPLVETAITPFDPDIAAQMYALPLTVVLTLWLTAVGVGHVVQMVRRA